MRDPFIKELLLWFVAPLITFVIFGVIVAVV